MNHLIYLIIRPSVQSSANMTPCDITSDFAVTELVKMSLPVSFNDVLEKQSVNDDADSPPCSSSC